MVSRGKSRRRRESNVKSAQEKSSQFSALPPPPKTRDLMAVPARLRQIMKYKESVQNKLKKGAVERDLREKTNVEKGTEGRNPSRVSKRILKEASEKEPSLQKEVEAEGCQGEEKKRKRRDVSIGNWKLSLAMKEAGLAPQKKGSLKEKRKQFLQNKKQKYKAPFDERQLERPLIRFGDVVEAPPKLSFKPRVKGLHAERQAEAQPTRKEKKNLEVVGESSASRERLRLAAIENYRTRRNWVSRPGSENLPEKLVDLG